MFQVQKIANFKMLNKKTKKQIKQTFIIIHSTVNCGCVKCLLSIIILWLFDNIKTYFYHRFSIVFSLIIWAIIHTTTTLKTNKSFWFLWFLLSKKLWTKKQRSKEVSSDFDHTPKWVFGLCCLLLAFIFIFSIFFFVQCHCVCQKEIFLYY